MKDNDHSDFNLMNADGTEYPACMGEMKCVLVTPDMALEWLANNPCNRKPVHKRITEMAEDMRKGLWEPNGSTIVFEKDTGALLDGQHRLNAILESEKPQWVWVCNGIDKTIHFDDGKPRSLTDKILAGGLAERTDAAADSNCMAIVNQLLGTGNRSKDIPEATAFAHKHNERLLFLKKLRSLSQKAGAFRGLATTQIFAAMFIALDNGVSEETVQNWYTIVTSGRYDSNNPWEQTALNFRNSVLNNNPLNSGKVKTGTFIAIETFNKAQQSIKAFSGKTLVQRLSNKPAWIWSIACPNAKIADIKPGNRYDVTPYGVCTVKEVTKRSDSTYVVKVIKPNGQVTGFQYPGAFLNGNVRRIITGE